MLLEGSVKHAVFEHWTDEHDYTHNATDQAAQFYCMTGQWADEMDGGAPREELEDFYLLVALKLGSPDESRWIERNAVAFYAMWDEWNGTRNTGAVVLVQYLLWYQRDKPQD
jgi:hypothetical protein